MTIDQITDKELVLELCKRLNLKETNDIISSHEYNIVKYSPESCDIRIGKGLGVYEGVVVFSIYNNKLVNHWMV